MADFKITKKLYHIRRNRDGGGKKPERKKSSELTKRFELYQRMGQKLNLKGQKKPKE